MLRRRAARDRIPAKTDREAEDRFLHFLRQSLRSVSEGATWWVKPPLADGLHNAFTSPSTLRIRTVDPEVSIYIRSTISFTFGEHPDYKGERKVFTEHYAHTVSLDPSTKPELWSWQWHPEGHEDAHIHVNGHGDGVGHLHRLHLPTGRITWEQVVRFIMTDLNGLPSRALGSTDEERMAKALALLGESNRRVQTFGRGRR